jgi:hypothetical protein
MASPFRYFRKHSKVFMATAAVICMFLFVFARGGGGNGSRQQNEAANATVATWNGGSINQRELASLVGQRVLVDDFLRRLFTQGGGRSPYDLPSNVPQLLLATQQSEQVESEVIANEVMASLARKSGITVSDDMINHYVEAFGLNNVSREDTLAILGSVGRRDLRENESVVFSMLRKMLAAYFYRSTFEDASYVVLPEQRWEDWRKVNERISLAVAELPVESFEKDVPAPTDAQLQALYNEYKDADPNIWLTVDVVGTSLPAPTPGFAEPRRVKLDYLSGSVAEQAEQFLDKVTDQEIADYYERNKRKEFVKTGFGTEEEESADAAPEKEGEADKQPAEGATPPAAEPAKPAAESTPSATPPAGEQPAAPSGEAAPATSPPAPAGDGAPAPAATTPSATPPAPENAPASNASSAIKRPSPFRLAAYQTTPAESPSSGAATSEAPSSATAPATPPAEGATPAGEAAAPSSESTAPGDAASPPKDEATPPAATGGNKDAASEAKPADATDADAKSSKPEDELLEYEPLEKVRDEIREALAREKAVDELEKVMSQATAELQSEYNKYGLSVAMAKEEKRATPKPPPKLADLKWLADKYKLKYEKTAALTDRELYDTMLGKAADAQSSTASVTRAAFLTLNPYEPFLAKELEGDWYLVIKTEDTPRRIPEFSEVRDRVLQAYKRREAATLAENKAKELAAEVEKSTQSFDEFFKSKGYQVIDHTDLFSWLTFPMGPGTGQPPSLSEVPKLTNVGPGFMEAAFSLKDKQAKGLLNFDHSMAYVIKVHTRQYPESELKELFLADEGGAWAGRGEMRYQRYSAVKNVVDRDILDDLAGFKFDEDWLKRRAERAKGVESEE